MVKQPPLPMKSLVEIAKEHGKKLVAQSGSLDNYFFVFEDGTVSYFRTQQACFSAFQFDEAERKNRAVLFVCNHLNRGGNADQKRYLKWLMTRSVFKDVFVSKDPAQILKSGCIISCMFIPQAVISAAIFVRYRYEFPEIINSWNFFRKLRVPAHLALVFAHWCRVKDKDTFVTNAALGNYGHQVISSPSFKREQVNNFVRGKFACDIAAEGQRVYDGCTNYRGLNICFGNTKTLYGGNAQGVDIIIPEGKEKPVMNSWGAVNETKHEASAIRKFVKSFIGSNKLELKAA